MPETKRTSKRFDLRSARLLLIFDNSFKQVSWTHALRQIVINCYKFHGREDLLPAFSEDEDKNSAGTSTQNKEPKVKNRMATLQHHSINVTNLSANSTITTVPISAEQTLAAQGVNVCVLLHLDSLYCYYFLCFVCLTYLSFSWVFILPFCFCFVLLFGCIFKPSCYTSI